MSSKQLDSILKEVPAATAKGEQHNTNNVLKTENEPISKIVARVPLSLKEEIRTYIKNNPGETESTIITKSLKNMGFSVDEKWMIDRRKLR